MADRNDIRTRASTGGRTFKAVDDFVNRHSVAVLWLRVGWSVLFVVGIWVFAALNDFDKFFVFAAACATVGAPLQFMPLVVQRAVGVLLIVAFLFYSRL